MSIPIAPRARILVRGVNWLGDAVMSTSALLRLRQGAPDARITLLTDEKLAGLWSGQSYLDEVIAFKKSDGVGGVSKQLRGKFDLALVLPNSFRSAFEAWLAAIPVRVGYASAGRNSFLTHAVPRLANEVRTRKKTHGEIGGLIAEVPQLSREVYPRSAHQIGQYHNLVATLVGQTEMPASPRIEVSAAEKSSFARSYFEAELASRLMGDTRTAGERLRLIGLNPGAEYGPAKRWPAERFIEAALLIEGNPVWIVFGGMADIETARFIEAGIKTARPSAPVINVAGRTSLRELCAGLALCDVVITNDTGPMHLAAAVGTRVVVPFGSTSPELTGPGLPGSPGHRFLLGQAACAPCFLRECPIDFRCMKSIEPNHVAAAAKSLLSEDPA